MRNSNIIFLGGIHGVGKGVIAKEMVSQFNINYLSASELIKWEEISPDIKNKKVENIPTTQERLLNALSKKIEKGNKYLLDGHYCLLNSKLIPTKIEIEVFAKINPYIVIVVTEKSEIIQQRLEQRDGKNYDLNLINKMQNIEIDYAIEIANELNVSYFVLSHEVKDDIFNKLKEVI